MTITPSFTAVQPLTRIRRERLLPQPGEVVIDRGEQVTPVQVVARVAKQRGFVIIPAAQILGVSPEAVTNYLLVEVGTAVQRKKPLLEKSSIFGSKHFASPVNGILDQVNNGRLILQQTPELLELRAMLHGFVIATRGNQGVVIETNGALIQAAWGTGQEGYGKLKVVVDDPAATLTEEQLDVGVRGSILVAGQIKTTDVLEKAEEISVRGVVLGHVPSAIIPALDAFRFPVIITEGFGTGREMSAPIFRMLQQFEGREASILNGGAGGRPEIIVPLPAPETGQGDSNVLQPLLEGQRVRILRAPHAGAVGKVRTVHTKSQATALGFRLPGASVELPGGQVVFVPNINLDVIR